MRCSPPIHITSVLIRLRAGSSTIPCMPPREACSARRVAKAAHVAGVAAAAAEREQQGLIDWLLAARGKMSVFRRLFEDFSSTDLAMETATPLAADFAHFRATGG